MKSKSGQLGKWSASEILAIATDPIGYGIWNYLDEGKKAKNYQDIVQMEQLLLKCDRGADALMNFAESDWGVLEPWLPTDFAEQLTDAIGQCNGFKDAVLPSYEAAANALKAGLEEAVSAGDLPDDTMRRIEAQLQRGGLGAILIPIVGIFAAAAAVGALGYFFARYLPDVIRAAGDFAAKVAMGLAAARAYLTTIEQAADAEAKYNAWRLQRGEAPVATPATDSIRREAGASRDSGSGSGFSNGALVGVVGTVVVAGLGVWALSSLIKGNK